MGLFGPPKPFRRRTFSMPCTAQEAFDIICAGVYFNGDNSWGRLVEAFQHSDGTGSAPLQEDIYISEFEPPHRVVVTAGNRVRTLWRVQLTLAGEYPAEGVMESQEYHDMQWLGNVGAMVAVLQNAVQSVGGRTGRWP